jgi:hypothetical protein
VSNKVSKNIGILRKLGYKLPPNTLLAIYNSLVLPYFQYCNIAWAVNKSAHINKLFRYQKKAVRIICHKKWDSHTTPLFKELNILKISDINQLQIGCFVFKALNNGLPHQFKNHFILNSTVHEHFTRQSAFLHLSYSKTKLRQNSIKYHGAKLWNALSPDLTSLCSFHVFKRNYKTFLISQYV